MTDKYPDMPASQAEWEAHWSFYKLTVTERDHARMAYERVQRVGRDLLDQKGILISIVRRYRTGWIADHYERGPNKGKWFWWKPGQDHADQPMTPEEIEMFESCR